ncbi:MAG: hypothetical protein ACP5OV_07775 [Acidimicrobiales bacterium]
MRYLVLVGIVVGVNLLPAFGPPTWAVLVSARLRWHLNPVALIGLGALSATLGRYVLATATRRLRGIVSSRSRANLATLAGRLTRRRGVRAGFVTLFVISPLPSAQLFSAAGPLDLSLVPLSVGFLAGRLVTYALYVTTTVVIESQVRGVLANVWGEPWWIALQALLLAGVVVLPAIPWGPSAPPVPPGPGRPATALRWGRGGPREIPGSSRHPAPRRGERAGAATPLARREAAH